MKWSKSFPGVNSFLDFLCNVADNHSHSRASPKSKLPTRFHLPILIATNCLTPARGSTGVLFLVCQQIDYVELSHALFQPIDASYPVTVFSLRWHSSFVYALRIPDHPIHCSFVTQPLFIFRSIEERALKLLTFIFIFSKELSLSSQPTLFFFFLGGEGGGRGYDLFRSSTNRNL